MISPILKPTRKLLCGSCGLSNVRENGPQQACGNCGALLFKLVNGIAVYSGPIKPRAPIARTAPLQKKPVRRMTVTRELPKDKEPDAKTLEQLRWQATKICWFDAHLPEYDGDYYQCQLCPYAVHKDETTLDHIEPRGTHPELRFVLTNLQAAHAICNGRKGSMSMERYLARFCPGGRWAESVLHPAFAILE